MKGYVAILSGTLLVLALSGGRCQMVSGKDMPGFSQTFRLSPPAQAKSVTVTQTDCSGGPNILLPGMHLTFTFLLTNNTDSPIHQKARVDVIRYGTSVPAGHTWTPHVFRIAKENSIPILVNIPAKGEQVLSLHDPVHPGPYGGLGLVFDFGQYGRVFGAAVARCIKTDDRKVFDPVMTLDMPWPFQMSDKVAMVFSRLGIRGCRMGASYDPTTSAEFKSSIKQLGQFLDWAKENNIAVMLTVGAGSAPQPLGRGRPWLNPDGSMMHGVKEDLVWLPSYDADFQKWCAYVCSRWGWPKGPVNALELWNEPWEGVSISGWGADMLRYRELYERMAKGVIQARKEAKVKVLIGGGCSSSNALDKLFPDGSDKFLPWFDFCSIHYQEMSAVPSIIPQWMTRKGPYGRVKVWDTESWVANSEDRIAAVIASMRAQGQDRVMGIYGGNVYDPENFTVGGKPCSVVQAWAPAAGVAAASKFIGQLPFRRILFKNGLPWVFLFRSSSHPENGTAVVVGDLGGVYDRNKLLFRGVLGLKNAPIVQALEGELSHATDPSQIKSLQDQLRSAMVLHGGSMTLSAGPYALYDFYGNPVPSRNGKIVVPLNGKGYFLRPNGTAGSYEKLVNAIRHAWISGYQPVDILCHDMLAPIAFHPTLRITLTNILNRPIRGELLAQIPGLRFSPSREIVRLEPGQTKNIDLRVVGGVAVPSNTYALAVKFNAGVDGVATHFEKMHVNVIAKRTITVDGDLSDWKGVLPQPISGSIGESLTEQAWLPFMNFGSNVKSGEAIGYLAYDSKYFYFAAKIADNTPTDGGIRYADRDDDSYFYPKVCTDNGKKLVWPAGVRRFSYRKNPDLPSGNGTDNVQIAFNVIPENEKPWWQFPKGTMPRFMAYWDTDYEFALNQVAPQYGGGTEIWKLLAPGIPRKHFYPRQPKAPIDGGPVNDGKLVIRWIGEERIVELALPWSEIPIVKERMDRGEPIKFSFRVNDDKGPAYELAEDRSVSKENFLAFHNDWETHWANEVQFAFQK
jgi:hypothetical protein